MYIGINYILIQFIRLGELLSFRFVATFFDELEILYAYVFSALGNVDGACDVVTRYFPERPVGVDLHDFCRTAIVVAVDPCCLTIGCHLERATIPWPSKPSNFHRNAAISDEFLGRRGVPGHD